MQQQKIVENATNQTCTKNNQHTTVLRVCKVKVKAVLYKVNYFINKNSLSFKFIDYSNITDKKLLQTRFIFQPNNKKYFLQIWNSYKEVKRTVKVKTVTTFFSSSMYKHINCVYDEKRGMLLLLLFNNRHTSIKT